MSMPSRVHHNPQQSLTAAESLVRWWLWRLLAVMNGAGKFVRSTGYADNDLASFLGLTTEDSQDDDEFDFDDEAPSSRFDPEAAHQAIRRGYSRFKRDGGERPPGGENLSRNLQELQRVMGFNTTERALLEFAVIMQHFPLLADATGFLPSVSGRSGAARLLATLLALNEDEVRKALAGQGRLAGSGFLMLNSLVGSGHLADRMCLLSEEFAEAMLYEVSDPLLLLKGKIAVSPPPTLTPADYPHVAEALAIAMPYLRQAMDAGQAGVNILLYGPPGTGKTELSRVLAQDLSANLYAVACEDEDGDPVKGDVRLRAYRAVQGMLSGRPALVLFDEIDDVFNDGGGFFGQKSTAQIRKGWINRMLEENSVPTFWLTNDVRSLDRAFLRRFDQIIAMPVPPKPQRERIVRAHCGEWLEEPVVRRLAECDRLSPAVVSRAANVMRSIRAVTDDGAMAQGMVQLVDSTLKAQGYRTLPEEAGDTRPAFYDPALIHCDTDLRQLAERMRDRPRANICLYGPPGTGKTAYGQWLADALVRPLLVRRASDLLGMYVGQTEQNLAECFAEAARSRSVLLIDEVDSFLQDRRQARHSWEVTQVNELLTQMEAFRGLLIATTNRLEALDQAVLRRFAVKLRFDYLRPEQAVDLLRAICGELGLPGPGLGELVEVRRLAVLTPGDFALVRQQAEWRDLASVAEVVRVLAEECALKEDGRKRGIGFV